MFSATHVFCEDLENWMHFCLGWDRFCHRFVGAQILHGGQFLHLCIENVHNQNFVFVCLRLH
jgi:hypothetical protein